MAAASKSSDLMSNITECSICLKDFTHPKALPCIHTFCLSCLEEYGRDKAPGDSVSCPLCKVNFTIPADGFRSLPNHPFINDLLELKRLLLLASDPASVSVTGPICGPCSALSKISDASIYCIDCAKNLCAQCNSYHGLFKDTSEHRVVNINEKPDPKELLRMTMASCEEHPKEQIKWFCYNCTKVLCIQCYVGKHNDHKCTDVNESAAEFRSEIKTFAENADTNALKNKFELDSLEVIKTEFGAKIVSLKAEIKMESDRHISHIRAHEENLLTEVESFETEQYKVMELKKVGLKKILYHCMNIF